MHFICVIIPAEWCGLSAPKLIRALNTLKSMLMVTIILCTKINFKYIGSKNLFMIWIIILLQTSLQVGFVNFLERTKNVYRKDYEHPQNKVIKK